jgi:hypothetical protein
VSPFKNTCFGTRLIAVLSTIIFVCAGLLLCSPELHAQTFYKGKFFRHEVRARYVMCDLTVRDTTFYLQPNLSLPINKSWPCEGTSFVGTINLNFPQETPLGTYSICSSGGAVITFSSPMPIMVGINGTWGHPIPTRTDSAVVEVYMKRDYTGCATSQQPNCPNGVTRVSKILGTSGNTVVSA